MKPAQLFRCLLVGRMICALGSFEWRPTSHQCPTKCDAAGWRASRRVGRPLLVSCREGSEQRPHDSQDLNVVGMIIHLGNVLDEPDD